MAEKLAIRFATIDDAETIHAAMIGIATLMGERERITSTPEDLRRHGFGAKPAFEALIAEMGKAAAGVCVYFASFSTYRGKPGVYVQDLFVDQQFRGLGVGAKLLQSLAAVTRKRGGCYIRLSVDAENVDAQGFYTQLGLGHSTKERIFGAYDAAFSGLADAGEALPSAGKP